MIHRTPPLKMVDVITVLEQSHRAEQDPVSEILRLFLVREIFLFPPFRRFLLESRIEKVFASNKNDDKRKQEPLW